MNNQTDLLFYVNCLKQDPPQTEPNQLYCSPIIDKLSLCWNYTKAGTTAYQPCPNNSIFNASANASKHCELDGKWFVNSFNNQTWTNIDDCIVTEKNVYGVLYITYIGNPLSAICLVISLFIFSYFKRLRCERVVIHKNLFSSYLINALFSIGYFTIINQPMVMEINPLYCQLATLISIFFFLSNYFWTFCEGFYLATVLILTFRENSKNLLYACYFCGWGIPLIVTVLYTTFRYSLENPTKCLMSSTKMHLFIIVPITLALIANLIIVIVLLKIVIMKLWHPVNREQKQWRKMAHAVFILFPVLGLQNVLFILSNENSDFEHVQYYIAACFNSFQGVVMSIILCFCNTEVRQVLFHYHSSDTTLRPSEFKKVSRRSVVHNTNKTRPNLPGDENNNRVNGHEMTIRTKLTSEPDLIM